MMIVKVWEEGWGVHKQMKRQNGGHSMDRVANRALLQSLSMARTPEQRGWRREMDSSLEAGMLLCYEALTILKISLRE